MLSSEFIEIRDQYREIVWPFQKEIESTRKEYKLCVNLWKSLTKARLFEHGLSYKGEDGLHYLAPALEGISYSALDGGINITLISHIGLCLKIVEKYCREEIKSHYIDQVVNHNKILAFSISEPHGGADAQKLETRFIPTKDGYMLRGNKWIATNGPIADLIITAGREENTLKPIAVIIESSWPGIEKKRLCPTGMTSSPLAQITYNDVYIPNTHILGNVGDGLNVLNEGFLRERLLVPFSCTGILDRLLEILLEYAQDRIVFDSPIAEYQYIRKRLTDIAINLETTRAISIMSLDVYKQKGNVNLYGSLGKLYSTNRCVDSFIHAIQVMGSYGLLENGFGEHVLSAIASTIAGGTEEMHREEIYMNIYRRFRKNKRVRKDE